MSLETQNNRTVFNKQSTGHETKTYPLFFGEEMGTYDTVNMNYPSIFSLYNRQMGQIWYSTEVDVLRDRIDLLQAPRDVVDVMMLNVQWQTAMDSVAARSVSLLLLKHITNPEMESLVQAWGLFEGIHAVSYADIVENIFPNPSDMIGDIMENENVMKRTDVLVKVFDNLYNLPDSATISEKRRAMILAFTAFYAMESISFMSSFTATFTIAKNVRRFIGISERVRLICRDEMLHQHFAFEVLRIMRDVEKYPEWDETYEARKEIIDSIVSVEYDWNEFLLKDREVLGLNTTFLNNAVEFFASPVYAKLGIEAPFELTFDSPVTHLNSYFDTSLIQTASQELQQTGYKTGSLVDDGVEDIEFFEI